MGGQTQRMLGFTLIEMLVAISIVALLIGIFLPVMGAAKRTSCGMKNSSQSRGMHQSMVIFAQGNNAYLPGLDRDGNILKPDDKLLLGVTGNGLTGASMAARYYVILNGDYVAGDLLISPQDVLSKWTDKKRMPTTDQFSYALLRIGDSPAGTEIGEQKLRAQEWRDNANSQALLIADRNAGTSGRSNQVRSVWSDVKKAGADWKGTVLWGDNHAEFLNAPHARLGVLSLETKYAGVMNSDDFLFGSADMPGKVGSASAMFGYVSENF